MTVTHRAQASPFAGSAPVRRGLEDTGHVRLALTILTALFAVRVGLQFVQGLVHLPAVPAFAAWDSGFLPYPWLLGVQISILGAQALLIRAVDGRVRPRRGLALAIIGGVYLIGMLGRAVIGIARLSDHAWFQAPLATSFHLVLASFLIVLGLHWRRAGAASGPAVSDVARWLLYPLTLAGAVALFDWSSRNGLPVMFAAYHTAMLGIAVVVIAEQLLPYRSTWRPGRAETATDALYLLVVQMALPALLSLGLASLLLGRDLPDAALWPHAWPVAAQVLLMLLAADFARYWLHRACHAWAPLWRLHAVHHAPERLHALNVCRFHPLEKTLQFTLDALPFVLLGVAQPVVAGYFVVYAVNGFFQHSNVDLRLGWLNWIVAGPELHRWHHAREPRLSDHNFGNNLIVWDAVFGTRWLPRGRGVDALGLINRAYPRGLLAQLAAPFRIDPNRTEAS